MSAYTRNRKLEVTAMENTAIGDAALFFMIFVFVCSGVAAAIIGGILHALSVKRYWIVAAAIGLIMTAGSALIANNLINMTAGLMFGGLVLGGAIIGFVAVHRLASLTIR